MSFGTRRLKHGHTVEETDQHASHVSSNIGSFEVLGLKGFLVCYKHGHGEEHYADNNQTEFTHTFDRVEGFPVEHDIT